MNEFRLGEDLWMEWDGEGYESEADVVYYTLTHIDTDIAVVQRALACALQRDGVAVSISDGFKMQTNSITAHGYIGRKFDEDAMNTACDSRGETMFGEYLDEWSEATFIDLNFLD